MSKYTFEIIFPCGYEFRATGTSYFRYFNWGKEDLWVCPLHGKKCK